MIFRIYNPRNSHNIVCHNAEEAFKKFLALGKNSGYVIDAECADGTVFRVSVKVKAETFPEQAAAARKGGAS